MKELSEVSAPLAREGEQQGRTGAYQSRIFTFFQRQTNRLRDGFDQSWRQVKVSVQITGKILLLPLRWLSRWQSNGQQELPSKSAPPLPEVIEKPAVAIERILAEVTAAGYGRLVTTDSNIAPTYEDWSSIDEQEWNVTLLDQTQRPLTGTTAASVVSSAQPQPIIRGLASRLSDRHLLLVDDHNQLLDVLSPSQQLHIRQRIDPKISLATSKSPTGIAEITGMTQAITVLPANSTKSRIGGGSHPISLKAGLRQPVIHTTPWQQLGQWFNFYREYLRIELNEVDSLMNNSHQPEVEQDSVTRVLKIQTPTTQEIKPSLHIDPKAIVGASLGNSLYRTNKNEVFTEDWIETPSRLIGYDRSWLVRFLEWLDGLVLAIENWIVSWYRRLFGHRS